MSWLHWDSRHPASSSLRADQDSKSPPSWTPAVERSRTFSNLSDAPDEYRDVIPAKELCEENPVDGARLLTSTVVEQIRAEGCKAWELTPPRPGSRFRGKVEVLQSTRGPKVIRVSSEYSCGNFCLMSNLPLMAGQYGIQGKEGVYYEVQIKKMKGTIAVGTACQPYPEYRLPGWDRHSAGLHLNDLQKFFEDPNGGRSYDNKLQKITPGDVIGCGYEFKSQSLFFTYNGLRLDDAFGGIYAPRSEHDVYAAIGVGGPGINEVIVNFGGDKFRWERGREKAWLVDGHVGRLGEGSGGDADELPSYYEQAINLLTCIRNTFIT